MILISALRITWDGASDPKSVIAWLLIVVAAAASVASVVVCIADKLRSRKKGRTRVSEATLMTLSAFGGALFMFLTMLIIRHKTRHPRFMVGLPLMIAFQAAIAYVVYF